MGAYVTPYPNVCLGVCGQWHHPITDAPPERPDYRGEEVAVDLGFILSNDGVHFREPAPGFTFIGRDQELSWDRDWRDTRPVTGCCWSRGRCSTSATGPSSTTRPARRTAT